MGCPQQPGRDELADLSRASVPQISLSTLTESAGQVLLQSHLEYNEFELLLLIPQD